MNHGKRTLAALLALMMILMAGCGSSGAKDTDAPRDDESTAAPTEEPAEEPKSNHVVDYKLDLPDGFEPTEQEGVDACWIREDSSNVNLVIADAVTDKELDAITADALHTTLVSQLKEAYGEEPVIDENYFSRDDISGLPAYQYSYHLKLGDLEMGQIIVGINADKLYTFSFTAVDDETMETFETISKNIQMIVE